MAKLKIGIIGAGGRMGQAVMRFVARDERVGVSALIVRPGSGLIGDKPDTMPKFPRYSGDLRDAIDKSEVLIDFSSPGGFDELLARLSDNPRPVVSGTTGISQTQLAAFLTLGDKAPVLYSPNMSVGVQVLLELLERAAMSLGPDYDIAVSETHHRYKRDSPSGTAKRMLGTLRDAVAKRDGKPQGEVRFPVHAIRGGDVVGDHSVFFMGTGDRIEITHRATARQTFAAGAVRAARWLADKPPGNYTMRDVLRPD